MTRRRVKITGIGPVTPAGIGREAFLRGINEPISRVQRVSKLKDKGAFIAAEVPEFKVTDWIEVDGSIKRLPRQTQFALAGTALALKDAGLSRQELAGRNPVILNGSSLMDSELVCKTITGVVTKGPKYANTTVIFEAPPISVAGHIADWIDTPSRIIALQTACCSGIDALGHGTEMIATGQTDIAICVGTEAPVTYQPMLELGMTKLSPQNASEPEKMCRPFDLWRSTGVIGEGAAVLILESETSPRPAYGWITGYAYANDVNTVSGSGLTTALRMALANAGRNPVDIDLINAWGPGHEHIDRVEAQCLIEIFGPRLQDIATVSLKGAIGNPLGAAGAIQAASVALSFRTGIIPPTVNWETPDPDCPLNLSSQPRYLRPRVAIVNSHGLSGSNATLVMEAS
jgi:3-oxoacyl-[acyl-carrier-protein] synthase II